ncbi:uncharacterized protein TNCV_705221 [Trichonephila clavipes]|nr:uncharacterized protein TNCV_705221 [Trichonephila clavipes]
MGIISILCCPECYATGLKLAEDSKEGLCSNLCVACSCGFMTGFTSTPKENKKFSLNTLLVFGLRLIGRGFTAGKKLLCTLNLPCISKNTFRAHELKLLEAVQLCSEENMKAASKEVQNLKKSTTCGVSVDGSWQRRGHMSLNGCVSVISIDTGKILDLEVMTQYCKMCELNVKREHVCSNYKGSSGNMEAVGAFRIFERSLIKRDLQYTEYYGDGDSKGFLQVKDIYGENSVTKLECIGHIQKRGFVNGVLETGGVMDKCVQMWTRNYGALGQTARVCFGVLCANKKKEEVKRDFGDLRIRRSEGRVVNTPLVFKRVLFQETRRPEKKGGDPKGEVEEKSSEKTRAGHLRKWRGESQSFDPCCCPRVKNADEKQRLADWTETSCGVSGSKTGIPYRL